MQLLPKFQFFVWRTHLQRIIETVAQPQIRDTLERMGKGNVRDVNESVKIKGEKWKDVKA